MFFEEQVGKLPDVEQAVMLWEQVDVVERDGRTYLASGGRITNVRKADASNSGLLLSLLNLVKPPALLTLTGLEDSISPEEAARWVREHGFPEIEERHTDGRYCWLSVQRFRRETVGLYLLFRLWQALLGEDIEEMGRLLGLLLKEQAATLSAKQRKVLARYYLSELMNRRLEGLRLGLGFFEPSGPVLGLRAPSLFALAAFQLACLMTQGERTQKHLKVCPLEEGGCGSLFWGHGNRKFCPQCDRRTAYSRRKRGYLSRRLQPPGTATGTATQVRKPDTRRH